MLINVFFYIVIIVIKCVYVTHLTLIAELAEFSYWCSRDTQWNFAKIGTD